MSKNAAPVKELRQHVVPDQYGGWSVRKAGANKARRAFGKKSEAVAYARELAKKAGGELYIHGKDGTVRERDTYDPHPPR
jgi:Uncharacterized protein conserved in bacteria (DUF2188)